MDHIVFVLYYILKIFTITKIIRKYEFWYDFREMTLNETLMYINN